MDTTPYSFLFIDEEVDIMISGADGAELALREGAKSVCDIYIPGGVICEQWVGNDFVVLAPNPEGKSVKDFIHYFGDVGPNKISRGIKQYGFVSATDVITNAGRTDLVAIRSDSTNRHSIPKVMVSHECCVLGIATAINYLLNRVVEGFSPYGYFIDFFVGFHRKVREFFPFSCAIKDIERAMLRTEEAILRVSRDNRREFFPLFLYR